MTGFNSPDEVRPHRNLRALYLTYLLLVIWAGVLSWLLPLSFLLPPFQTLLISGVLFIVVIMILLWTGAYFRTIIYRFDSSGILWERGVFIHRSGLIPYHLITNLDIVQVPISRFFGIYQLKIQAAGTSLNPSPVTLKINGLTDPKSLRDYILGWQLGSTALHKKSDPEQVPDIE
jgi:membrane protein YdbS with pleckstrin-like domain